MSRQRVRVKSDVGMTAGSTGGQVATVVGLTVVGLCK